MIVQIWEVKRVACYARAVTFTEAVASVASMVATPLLDPWISSQNQSNPWTTQGIPGWLATMELHEVRPYHCCRCRLHACPLSLRLTHFSSNYIIIGNSTLRLAPINVYFSSYQLRLAPKLSKIGGTGTWPAVIGNFAPRRKCPPRQFSLVNTVPKALFSSEYCPPGALFT